MSYEKQTWVTGETVTADKLNHMEDGIADAGGASGTYMCSIWNLDSTGNPTTDGDYATARALLADCKPIVCTLWAYNLNPAAPIFDSPTMLSPELTENSIKLWLGTSYGYEWDANGIAYFDV